jgi:hypothetical protein
VGERGGRCERSMFFSLRDIGDEVFGEREMRGFGVKNH